MKFPETFLENSNLVNVIIETPRSSSNKYAFHPETGLYKLTKILPNGIVFPHHFGFIPNTKGQDGDPLDVLILMNEPSYPGCLVETRIIGSIEAEETLKNKTIRNDRFIGVAVESHHFKSLKSFTALDKYDQEELINFLIAYNRLDEKDLKIIKCIGPQAALASIKKQII